ncbi:transposable element Tcb2 transposase [Trichonephila clavipes]|nr:transposable element Tcb2 transposase [Trichonephila clavipes]
METVPGYWIHREKAWARATAAREDRHLSILARCNRGTTDSQLSHYMHAATGARVSSVTVSKRLHERGLFARRPTVASHSHLRTGESI